MTSRNLCFKLMKEDVKRRVWTIALTVLSLVFTLLVPVAIKTGAYLDELSSYSDYEKQWWVRELTQFVGINGMVVFILVALSVVWAVSGFRYLHNSRQVDFYHSIPVKRGQLFLASYLNGIWMTAAIYFVIQAMSAALIFRTGIEGFGGDGLWWKMYFLNMLYYIMLYTTTVIAMMMTGNIVVALLGTTVFCGYGPAVLLLVKGYQEQWFHTICDTAKNSMAWIQAINRSSPFANYMFALENFSYGRLDAGRMVGAVVVTGALAVVAYSLYRIRPSESAGKAMAFKKTESPIKVLIALPAAVVFGILFYSLRSTVTWGIFGAVCGTVITCCLMEIIYHFDFRKLFDRWIQMAACGAVSVLLVMAGIYDWYGFDSWLPKATSVKSASVTIGYEDNWVTYGKPVQEKDYLGRVRMVWSYEGQKDYQYRTMELTDIYSVMELARKGVRADQEIRRGGSQTWDSWNREYHSGWRRCTVGYRLSNGKEVFRQYAIPMDEEAKALVAAIHDNREYKKGTYPVMSQTSADTAAIYFQQYDQTQSLEAGEEGKARVLTAYQKDLEELTMAVREKELPIGTIQFRTVELQQAVDFYQNNDQENEGLENRCYYPVYPSFTRTIQAVKEAGGKVEELNAQMISQIGIQYYDVYEGEDMTEEDAARAQAFYEGREIIYDQEKDIDILSKALVFSDYYNMNPYYQADCADNAEAMVTFAQVRISPYRVRHSASCRIDLNRLTEEEAKKFGFRRYGYEEESYD